MPDTNDQILAELRELKSWLYGQNGFVGDIPTIKKQYEELCNVDKAHDKRVRTLEKMVAILSAIFTLSGIGLWATKLLGG